MTDAQKPMTDFTRQRQLRDQKRRLTKLMTDRFEECVKAAGEEITQGIKSLGPAGPDRKTIKIIREKQMDALAEQSGGRISGGRRMKIDVKVRCPYCCSKDEYPVTVSIVNNQDGSGTIFTIKRICYPCTDCRCNIDISGWLSPSIIARKIIDDPHSATKQQRGR